MDLRIAGDAGAKRAISFLLTFSQQRRGGKKEKKRWVGGEVKAGKINGAARMKLNESKESVTEPSRTLRVRHERCTAPACFR